MGGWVGNDFFGRGTFFDDVIEQDKTDRNSKWPPIALDNRPLFIPLFKNNIKNNRNFLLDQSDSCQKTPTNAGRTTSRLYYFGVKEKNKMAASLRHSC